MSSIFAIEIAELLSQIIIVNACMHFKNPSEVLSLIIEILDILKHLSLKL